MHLDSRTQQQFQFIELVLAYEGEITNQRLREKFDIASVQASRVLRNYRDEFPHNTQILRGQSRGRYAPSARFKPEVTKLSIELYFDMVKCGTYDNLVETTQTDFTDIDPQLFRVIRSAINQCSAIRLTYRSMNNPKGIERTIHPHAFVFAGRRWHIRGFDEHTNQHRDFNLARISRAQPTSKSMSTPADLDWEEKLQVELRPHPSLNEEQQKLIRDELFKGAVGRVISTRRALVRYTLRDLEVAEDPNLQKPPEFQIYLFRIQSRSEKQK